MDPFINGLGFIAGLVLVYRAGAHIEAMTRRSNHFVRLAYYAIAVGGAALVLAPLARDAWMRPFAWVSVLMGVALLFIFDKRKSIDRAVESYRETKDGI